MLSKPFEMQNPSCIVFLSHRLTHVYQGGNSLLQNVRFKSEDEVQLRYRDGFKLALSSQEIEQSKAKADHATNIIQSLLIAKSNAQAIKIGNQVKSRTRNTTRSLTRIRAFANQLHQAIATCWTNGCHSDHEFNLHLEDRIDSTQAVKSSVRFDTIFVSKGSRNSQNRVQISRASLIEVFCNDNDGQDALTNSGGLRSSNVHVPRLVIPQEEPRLQVLHSRKIADMCLEVCRMYHATETLKLYVHPSCTIHQSHSASTQHPPAAHSDAVTLKELLSQNLRLFPRRCTELALILASALLQFSETPWCATYWTKDGVYFTKKDPSIPTQNLQMGDVDITRPLTVKAFQRLPSSNNQDVSKPTKATLELGILMLEIWHGISLEDRFHDRPNQLKGDDLDRKQLADRWLREDDHLNFQQDAVQTCLDCFNIYGAKGDITWEDEDFLHSFVEGVIEPLYKASNKSRS